ncbi:MAG: hydrogenase expression/formation C-terminal domain-containing protein [Woeseiaceae bacterium]|jgi:hydrogenase-1 operon protein HyaF|nr:hydrogenase expression/formation C-terminal domain-containing protein [Woeseiaceae bacterium]
MNSTNPLNAASAVPRGNVEPILNEVAHALDRLVTLNEPTVIDLARLPFSPGELEKLEEELGEGELNARLDSLGESIIRETAFPGVWWLEHRNAAGEIVGRFVEVTYSPDILRSQDVDISAGRGVLREKINRLHETQADRLDLPANHRETVS